MPQTGPDPQPPQTRRWRPLRWILRGLVLVLVGLAGVVLYLAYPPNGQPVPLPEAWRARVEAAIDDSMPTGDITVGGIGLSLSRSDLIPRIRFTDMRLSEGGQDRVVLPVLDVELDRRALLQRQVRPLRVSVGGAGLRIRRDADGSLDLAFTGAGSGEERDLAETLAGIDRMFQQPVFAHMERVSGTDLSVILEDARSGESLSLDGARLTLMPAGQMLTLSVGGQIEGRDQSELAFAFVRRAELGETSFSASFGNLHSRDVALVSEALAWLTLIDAPMSGQLSTVLYDDASVGTLSGTFDVGEGRIVPGGGVAPQPMTSLSLAFDYDAAAARLWLEYFSLEAPALSARISGHATLLDGPVYLTQLQVSEISADPPGLFDAPLTFDGGALDFRLQLEPVVSVELGQAVLFDEGVHLRAQGRIAAEEDGLAVRLDMDVPELDSRRVPGFWPEALLPNTRRWIDENVTGGTIRNVHSGLRLVPGTEPQFALTFDFSDAEVRALRRMAPIEQGQGYLDISHNQVSIVLHQGVVRAPDGALLDLAGSVMRIHDTRQRQSPATLDLQIAGGIPSALTLIAAEPFTLLDRFPFDPATVAQGRARIGAEIGMVMRPRITTEDITFEIDGQLSNVFSDALVPGRELRAASLRVQADNERLAIGGQARLDGMRATATWSRAIGRGSPRNSTVEGTAILTRQGLARFGVRLPDGMLSGRGEADFTLSMAPETAPRLSVRSDLDGLALAVPALGWSLPASATGRLDAEIVLGSEPRVPDLQLSGAGLRLAGAVDMDGPDRFDRLRIERLQVGDWLDVAGALIGEGQGVRVEVTGGQADMRGLPSGGGTGNGDPVPLNLRLDRFDITESIYLTDLRAELTGGAPSGTFRGLVGGEVPVAGNLLAEANGTALRLRADDGGAVLRAAGIYPNSHGGALDLILRPLPGDGRYSGLLTIDNPRLRNAPAFAELLSAVSVVGLLDQMASGEGVALGEVRAVFTLSPGQVAIQEGTALGPAMGLSLDGVYDTTSRTFDFEGVVSPFYVVNGLVGGLFTPRREGAFGFTYRLTGTPEDSSVSVNPFSVLTPGIFREIFRRPPPEPAQ